MEYENPVPMRVAAGTAPERRRVGLVSEHVAHCARDGGVARAGSDADRHDREVVQVVDGAIDGVDDPGDLVDPMLVVEFLTKDGRAGATGRELAANQ